MNKAILTGRLTKDPELKKTQNDISVCSFTIAVDRKFKDQSGNKITDFIPIVAWRQQADLIGQYFHKGSRISIVGTIQVRQFTDANGNKRQAVEVITEEIEFVDTKSEAQKQTAPQAQPAPSEILTPPPVPQMEPTAETDGSQLPFDIMGGF